MSFVSSHSLQVGLFCRVILCHFRTYLYYFVFRCGLESGWNIFLLRQSKHVLNGIGTEDVLSDDSIMVLYVSLTVV